jgi:hypothetical protein
LINGGILGRDCGFVLYLTAHSRAFRFEIQFVFILVYCYLISIAEPPPDKRGNIARTYFYMDWAYPGHGIISKKNKELFKAWDKEDPVGEWECERCKRIEGIQGNENPFVRKGCEEKGMW